MEEFLKLKPDHRAILVKDREVYDSIRSFLTLTGYQCVYEVDRIGGDNTAMATYACRHPMTNDCLAIVYGLNAPDEFSHAHAPFDFGAGGQKAKEMHTYVQHLALRTNDIFALRNHLEGRGARFLTPVFNSKDSFGPLLQCFTRELLDDEWFFMELTQRNYDINEIKGKPGHMFSDTTVRSLYNMKQQEFLDFINTKKKIRMFEKKEKTKEEIEHLIAGLEPKGFEKLVPGLVKILK